MVNAVPAVASNSVSVKPLIIAVDYPSPALVRITITGGVSIVSRQCYFKQPLAIEKLPVSLTAYQLECLHQAGRRYAAERQAVVYLNRAEHSIYQLTDKLQKKGFSFDEYQPVLRYLTEKGLLDDSRFAASWLHIRSLVKKEGRRRLFLELRKRGISSTCAQQALEDFFTETDEESLCAQAAIRLMRQGYSREKLFRALQRKGFPYSMIKRHTTSTAPVDS